MAVFPRTIPPSMVLRGHVPYPDSAPWPGASIFCCKCRHSQTLKRSVSRVSKFWKLRKKKSAINGLAQSSFSYDVPGEGGLAKISGYLHVNKPANLTEATVRRWISDGRISGDIEWTPVLPGRHGDWKQHSLILAVCNASSTRRLHDWLCKG